MAIEAQLNNQPDSNSPSLDPVEQLKAQAKIQMAITTAELDGPLPLPALSAESQTEASPIVSSPDHTDANGSVTAWVPAQANPESNSGQLTSLVMSTPYLTPYIIARIDLGIVISLLHLQLRHCPLSLGPYRPLTLPSPSHVDFTRSALANMAMPAPSLTA